MTIIQTGQYAAILIDGSGDIDITVYHQDAEGDPIDLTNYQLTWTFQIGETTLTATIGSGLTVDAPAGKIVLHFEKVAAVTLPEGLGRHRLVATAPVDKILFKGALTNDSSTS